MGNKQLHVKWPRALLRFISVRLENPNKIAIAILSSTFWCRNPGLFIPYTSSCMPLLWICETSDGDEKEKFGPWMAHTCDSVTDDTSG